MTVLSGTAELSCERCANTFNVDAWDLDLEMTGSEERNMGIEVFYGSVTGFVCPICGQEIELIYDVSEYPVGVLDYYEAHAKGARIVRGFREISVPLQDRVYSLDEQAKLYVPPEPAILTVLSRCLSEMVEEIARDPQKLYVLTPRQFEELIAEIFSQHQFKVDLTRRTRDGGRDIIAVRADLGIQVKYIIECKRYSRDNPVGVGLVRSLYGVQVQEGANKSVLVTTSRFTPDAKQFALGVNTTSWHMELKEFEDVARWAREAMGKRRDWR